MKAISLALASLLLTVACAQGPEASKPQSSEAQAGAAEPTDYRFTLATCLPPASSVYVDVKRLVFLVNFGDDWKGPMDLMFETEPSTDSNNELGFTVFKGGEVRVEDSAWAVSISILSDSGRASLAAKMPANVPGEQEIDITFANDAMTVVETWTCRVH